MSCIHDVPHPKCKRGEPGDQREQCQCDRPAHRKAHCSDGSARKCLEDISGDNTCGKAQIQLYHQIHHPRARPVRCLTVRQMVPQTNSGSASIKPASVPAKSMIVSRSARRSTAGSCRRSARLPPRRRRGGGGTPALSLSGTSPRAASGCALSLSPARRASRRTAPRARSLSSSGMLASVSHLDTDWRLTSSASARSRPAIDFSVCAAARYFVKRHSCSPFALMAPA